jgi:hypothetical protein
VSTRGRRHAREGIPRQDHVSLLVTRTSALGPTLLIAVADGVSAAPRSHLACQLACRAAIGHLATSQSDDPQAICEGLAPVVAERLVDDLLDQDDDPGTIATTLSAAVVRPTDDDALAVDLVLVGDSPGYVVSPDTSRPWASVVGDGAQPVVDAALDSWLPGAPTSTLAQVSVPAGAALLLATDGVGNQLGACDNPYAEHLVDKLAAGGPTPWSFAAWVANRSHAWSDDQSAVLVVNRRAAT